LRLGRWISQDPVLALSILVNADVGMFVGDILNLYAYGGNSPLNQFDPTGLDPDSGFFRGLADKFGDAARVFVLLYKFFDVGPTSKPPSPPAQQAVDENTPNQKPASSGTGPNNDPPKPPDNPNLKLEPPPAWIIPLLLLLGLDLADPAHAASDLPSTLFDASLDPSLRPEDSSVDPSTTQSAEPTVAFA
jgi:hypothetical protein